MFVLKRKMLGHSCDCTEWMRNGDFTPNRFDAQKDAVGVICQTKIDQHPENTVGIIAMGKDQKAEVLVNCSRETGRVLAAAHKMKIEGSADILVAIQTAQLALKHRKNKKQTQRIILFVGSPIKVSVKLLVKAGKKLKKNNVAVTLVFVWREERERERLVDIVNFGEEEHNTPILEEFLKAVKSTDNSHLITVPSGTQQLLSDMLIPSPIFAQQAGMNDLGLPADGSGASVPGENPLAAGGNRGFEADMDADMATAIRQSLEEERARQEAMTREQQPQSQAPQQVPPVAADDVPSAVNSGNDDIANENDEQVGNDEMEAEDEELLQALQMSIQPDADEPMQNTTENVSANQGDVTQVLDDDAYMNELLSGLPGVGIEDIDIHVCAHMFSLVFGLLGEDKEKSGDGDTEMKDKDKKKDKSKDQDKDDETDT
ncbi:hypothetical protein RFI_04518 [Reticulomyxa filosa]|uniref:VWFA domain-containing protein n=1 Tax=Reticulomyxa filosa TaxID=46433 RepID=X6P2Z0_RETFI|nr:hypothetical protein RFI_04518 [Reticulomyxa filosa]|eukprot:ETO32601.1 hypothetical protein RFI_04518 [Reticulomyxa filosa]